MWIGLPVEGDAHVTVVMRHVDYKENEMRQVLHGLVAPLLPIRAVLKPGIVMRGWKGDVPTMDVAFLEPEKEMRMKQIYAQYYTQVPEHKAYPELQMHMTVDSPERLATANRILTQFDGKWVATQATLKYVGDKTLVDRAP